MKKFQLLLFTLFTATLSFAQVQVCLGTDVTVCQGQTVQITDCGSGAPGGGITLTAPTAVNLSDDNWSGIVPMGFNFSFYGNNYSNCVIGANGIISFNTANAGGYCAWALNGAPLPSATNTTALNAAMVCYQDLNPANGTSGPVQYQTLGTAPNRKFVVLYNGVTMFSCVNSCAYIGYIFYESTNVIEYFIGSKGACANWNGGLAIQGTQNNAGNVAHITPGRNNTVWAAVNDGKRFTPTSPTNTSAYSITTIPYVNINAPGGQLSWANTLTSATTPYNGGVLNITSVPPGTTGYFLVGTSCGVSVGAVSDTTWVTRTTVTANTTATTDYCSGGNGTATATPVLGTPTFTYAWNTVPVQTTQTATGLVAGTYQVIVTDANNCSVTKTVVVPNSPATFSATSTLVSCPGGSDGTATATMNPVLGTLSYNWYDAGGQTGQTATGLSAGTYHCAVSSSVGCTDTVTVTVTEIPGMVGTVVLEQPTSCNSGSDGIMAVNVTAGTAPYTYSWGTSTSTLPAANDLAAGSHTVTVTDDNGCVITLTGTIGEPAPLAISMLSPDAIICPESPTTLTAQGTGGSTAYTFSWTENGTPIGTGASITVDPTTSGTVYCVTLSEACGSPTTDSCMTITFPTEIIPSFIADKPTDCQPGTFTFTNTSNNPNEIATVLLEFGDGSQALLTGTEDTTHTYAGAQSYTLRATITSTHGCVTQADFVGLVTVLPKPTADFNFSANPTTFFETTIIMQDKSSAGVITWEWNSPGSTPTASTYHSPVFTFPEGVIATYPVELIVTTAEGCKDTVEHILHVNSDVLFFAPNSFTPDGDEFNQTWGFSVSGVDEYNFELTIFNRWGEIVWETHDIHASWDGTYHGQIAPAGGYTWIAKTKNVHDDQKRTFKGECNIIR